MDATVWIMDEVEIYSSQTGAWTSSESKWIRISFAGHTAYFNGFQHFTTWDAVIVLADVKGQQPWRTIRVPSRSSSVNGFVGHSQGHLLYTEDRPESHKLGIFVLEDHTSDKWTLKHRVNMVILLRPHLKWQQYGLMVAAHPRFLAVTGFSSMTGHGKSSCVMT